MNERSCFLYSRRSHLAPITRMLHLPHFVSAFLRSLLCSCLLIPLFLSRRPSPRTSRRPLAPVSCTILLLISLPPPPPPLNVSFC